MLPRLQYLSSQSREQYFFVKLYVCVRATKRTIIRWSMFKSFLIRLTFRFWSLLKADQHGFHRRVCPGLWKRPRVTETHHFSPRNFLDPSFWSFPKYPPPSFQIKRKKWSPTFVLTNVIFSVWTVDKNKFCENVRLYPMDGWMRLSDRAFTSWLPSLQSPPVQTRSDVKKKQFYGFPDIYCLYNL